MPEEPGQESGLLEKLNQIRRGIITVLVVLVGASLFAYTAAPSVLEWAMAPLGQLVYLSPAEAFMARIKMALALGFIITLPVLLWEIWRLVAPALGRGERRLTFWLIPAGFLLFLLGSSFAYYGVLPVALRFFLSFGSDVLQPMISLGNLVSFTLGLVLPFGLVFELPIVILFLSRLGLVTSQGLREKRKFAILLIFIAAAALTPGPDIFSQLLMGVPLLMLYEVSVWLARLTERRRAAAAETEVEAEVGH